MRVLVVRLSALGDVVTASPVSRVLKQARPDSELVWAVERRCADAVIGNPFVDEVVALPSSRDWKRLATRRPGELLRTLAELRTTLRGRRFDVVLDLQGLAKSALLAGMARAPRKIMPADAGERLPWLFTESAPRHFDPRRVASMYVSLLEPLGIRPRSPEDYRLILPVGDDDRTRMTAWLARQGLQPGGYVACAPGTTRPQKHWRAERWAPVLGLLEQRLGLPALLLGGPAEAPLAATIMDGATSGVVSAVGQTSIKETGALLEMAAACVTVDTGPMHMAVAAGCPTVALFGSTPPRLFEDGSRYIALYRDFACSPCHRHPICPSFECLGAIRVVDVLRAVERLLTSPVS